MKEMKRDETLRVYSLIGVLGITVLAFLMLISIASASPYAYIPNMNDNNISVIDTVTNTITSTVSVGDYPYGVAVTSDGKKVYITCENGVSVIDTTTNRVTNVRAGSNNIGIAVNSAGKNAYLACGVSKSIYVIDTATNTVTATVGVGSSPWGIAVTPDGKKVYVTIVNSKNVFVIDTATNTVTATVGVGSNPWGIAVTPDGKKVYVANSDSNTVSVIDTATNTVISTINVGYGPIGVTVTPDGTKIYVANANNDTVSVINAATNTVTATVNGFYGPFGISATPDGKGIYVANRDGNTVSVIDTATNRVIASVHVGNEPLAFGQFIASVPAPAPIIPVANFSVNTTEGFAPLTVQFTDLSSNATSVKWDFGDGNNSTDTNPMHTYYIAGNYTVNLTVSNANGTDSKLATINVTEKPILPIANFSASPTLGNVPLNVTFTDKSTGSPTAWEWTFGDGANSTAQNVTHNYSKAGNYTVALTVSNAAGSNKTIKTNYIKVTTAIPHPTVIFTADPISGNVPLKVKFTDKSTGSPTSWKWSFGDGAYSTVKNPTYTYNGAGKYNVSLTVKNAAGSNKTTKMDYIEVTILKVPVAVFTASPTTGKHPLTVKFTDKSTGSPTSWSWNFGDKITSTAQNPAHKYTKAGKYTVKLIVKNAAGSNSKTMVITVK